jgi:hypothetical protein
MAQLDPNIILQAKQPQIENPMNNLAKLMQVQGMQQQNQLGQLKMDEHRVAGERRNKLASLLQGQYETPEARESALLSGGFMDEASKLGTDRRANQKSDLEIDTSRQKLATERYTTFKKTLGALESRPDLSKDLVTQVGQELVAAGIIPDAMYQTAIANMPDDPNQLRMRLREGVTAQMAPDKMLEFFAPKPEKIDSGQTIGFRDTNPNSPTYGQNTGGAPVQKQMTPGEVASSRVAQGNLAVAQGNLQVSRDRLGWDKNKPTNQPGGRKPMTAAQEAKYREEVAKDYQAANTNLANMNEVLNSIDEVRTAPGLDGVTGASSYFPSIPGGKAAAAEVRLKNLEGKITQLGKAAAAQGGAVGPMAVQEWKIVRDMIASVDPAKGKQAMLDQIDLIEQTVIGAAERIKDVYSKQYSPDADLYPQFQELKIPKRGTKPTKEVAPKGGRIRYDAQGNEIP